MSLIGLVIMMVCFWVSGFFGHMAFANRKRKPCGGTGREAK